MCIFAMRAAIGFGSICIPKATWSGQNLARKSATLLAPSSEACPLIPRQSVVDLLSRRPQFQVDGCGTWRGGSPHREVPGICKHQVLPIFKVGGNFSHSGD